MLRSLVALTLLAQSGLCAASAGEADIAPWQHPEVVKVDCDKWEGTAFRIGPGTLLSVAHIVSNKGCRIGGEPVKVLGKHGDFAVLSSARPDSHWLKVDCLGFIKGKHYLALGYARDRDTLTSVEVVANGEREGGQAVLDGVFTFIPGQSGGPVIDIETGRVVGAVNTYDDLNGESGSVELRGESICKN